MSDGDSSWVYVAIAVCFILFLVIGAGLVYYGIKHDYFKKEEPAILYDTFLIRGIDNSTGEVVDGARYVVSQDALVIQEGTFKKDSLEQFSLAVNGSNYTLSSWSTDFYHNKVLCYSDQEKCTVNMLEIGHDYSFHVIKITDTLYRMVIYVPEGYLNDPLICFRWNAVFDVDLEGLEITSIPERYQNDFDKCYQSLDSFEPQIYYEYDIVVDNRPVVSSTGESKGFSVFFDDTCENPDMTCSSSSELSFVLT